MSRTLFREEALNFQREKHLGEVVLALPLSSSLLALTAVWIALSLLAFAFYGEYTRKAHVQGYLSPSKGLLKVYAPETGVVIEKKIVEGQAVRLGDPLFVVSTERGSPDTPQAQAAAIERLKQKRDSLRDELVKQASIDRIQNQSLRSRLEGLGAEQAQLRREIAIQEQRVASAHKMLLRYQELVLRKFVSEVSVQQKQEELLDQQAKLQALQRSLLTLSRESMGLRTDLDSSDLRSANQRASIERNIAAAEQELTEHETRRVFVIAAPGDGVVTTILAEPGQNVNGTSPLVSILPQGAELQAHLLVPTRAIGFLRPGQQVSLRYQAFPYQRFGSHGGRVKEIAKTLIIPSESKLPIALNEPVYRVTVAMDRQAVQAYGNGLPLQAGMLLDADIWLDRLRIVDWIFDPLYSVTGRL